MITRIGYFHHVQKVERGIKFSHKYTHIWYIVYSTSCESVGLPLPLALPSASTHLWWVNINIVLLQLWWARCQKGTFNVCIPSHNHFSKWAARVRKSTPHIISLCRKRMPASVKRFSKWAARVRKSTPHIISLCRKRMPASVKRISLKNHTSGVGETTTQTRWQTSDISTYNTVQFLNPTSLWVVSYTCILCGPSKCQSFHVKHYLYSEHCYSTVA